MAAGADSSDMGRNGLNTSNMAAIGTCNYEDGKTPLSLNGSVRWNHRNGDVRSESASENFVGSTQFFLSTRSTRATRRTTHGMRRCDWNPHGADMLANLLFRPSFGP